MKTRINVKSATKVISVKGKKILYFAFMLVFVILFSNCQNETASEELEMTEQTELCPTYEGNWAEYQTFLCIKLLDECTECGILDEAGIKRYNEIKNGEGLGLADYMELIEECKQEEMFFDTVGEGDAYWQWKEDVYEPIVENIPVVKIRISNRLN